MKKITALALLASLQLSLTVPVFAIEADKTTQEKTKKVWFWNKKEEKIVKGNISYINFDWWNSFEDPILSEYIALAIDKNHDMKIATLATKEYYQNYKIQFGTELPQLQAGFMPGLAKAPGSSDTLGSFALPLIASYEVDIFLKNRDKTKSVQRMYEASLMDERAAHIAVASAVGTTYFNVVMLDEAIKLQEQIIAHRQEIYDLKLLSNKEGLVSTSDTIRANKALVHGQAELLELQKQREKALNQLAVLIGESPENIANLKRTDLNTLLISNKIPQSISSEVIENRPDYLKSAKMVEKAGLDVRIAKKEFLPSINLGAMAFFNNHKFESLFTTKNMLLGLGASALLPIFTGGQKMGNLRLKKATYERVLQQYLKTNLTAIQEVNDALVSAKLDWAKLGETLKAQELEQKEHSFSQMKFNEGLISKLDLLQHEENLLTIDMLVAQQKTAYLVDYIGLYKACGAQI